MKKSGRPIIWIATMGLASGMGSASPANPYVEQESREIKAMSAGEIQSYGHLTRR
jgi:hypothetical protein